MNRLILYACHQHNELVKRNSAAPLWCKLWWTIADSSWMSVRIEPVKGMMSELFKSDFFLGMDIMAHSSLIHSVPTPTGILGTLHALCFLGNKAIHRLNKAR